MEESSYDGSTNRSHSGFLSVLCVYLFNFLFFFTGLEKNCTNGEPKGILVAEHT